MITVRTGNLLDSKAQTLVNTVNCVGVMGKGIALQFRQRFPDMYQDYVSKCERREVRLGRPYVYKTLTPPWILNFPTKDHWRSVSRLSDIVDGLKYLLAHYKEWGIRSMAVPPLGCGNGQLEWQLVGPTLYRWLAMFEMDVELYAPMGTPLEQTQPEFLSAADKPPPSLTSVATQSKSPLMPAWVALAAVVGKLEKEPHSWPVGQVTFQKIAYFATIAGVPTGLEFHRASYGPFSKDLKHVISLLVNHGLIREQPLGTMVAVRTGPAFWDAMKVNRDAIAGWAEPLGKVFDLFLRMRTQDAEIAATIVYGAKELAKSGDAVSEMAVLDYVTEWKKRKRPPIPAEDFASNIRYLNMRGWVDLVPSPELPIADDLF